MASENAIRVRGLEDGDFEVVRGGDIYRRSPSHAHNVFPDSVKRGDRASAAEICEWQELGVQVSA